MKGSFIYSSAQRNWEDPPETEEDEKVLPPDGMCPWCREDLSERDEIELPFCKTFGCEYRSMDTEEENRKRFEEC